MASLLKVRQRLRGKFGTYDISKKLHKDVWAAVSTQKETFIIKTAPQHRLDNEREVLKRFHDQPYVRPLIDEIQDPPSLVLKHLDDNLLNASNSKRLERSEIKLVAKNILEALRALHQAGYVHTDIKPDNILVNYGKGTTRFSNVQLGDCGDVYRVDLNADPKDMAKEDGHVIGAAMFRSPEAMLNLRWGTATDIWSFGTTLISLIWGKNWHIFKPDDVTIEDEAYAVHVLIKQANYFGPFPVRYQEIAEDERLAILTLVMDYSGEKEKRNPFSKLEDVELTEEDRDFVCKIMKLDPRDRPTAKELLKDDWFASA